MKTALARFLGPPRRIALLVLALVPVATGCKNFNLFTIDQDVTMGLQAYEEFIDTAQVVETGPEAELVRDVTARLALIAEERHPETAGRFAWKASLVESEQVNAFCLPGGYMAVYTGILPVTQSADGLAVVMGHELAHATLRHGTKKVSRAMGFEAITLIAEQYARQVNPDLVRSGLNLAVQLPYGREAELEADREGLLTMAAAGYDPREAVEFWKRMASAGKGSQPEWLSTHPSDTRRITELEAMLPEALLLYERARGSAGAPAP